MKYDDVIDEIIKKHGNYINKRVFESYIKIYREAYQEHNPHDQAPKSGFTNVVGWGSKRSNEFRALLQQSGISINEPPYQEEINPDGLSEKGFKRLSELEKKIC
jgi:hypothetical protein